MTSPDVQHPAPASAAAPVILDQRLEQIRQAGEQLHRLLVAEVRAQRMAGASWPAVGRWLGVSRQAARQRWRYLDDLPVALCRRPGGSAYFGCPATGAVIGTAQIDQVRAAGVIDRQHELCPARP